MENLLVVIIDSGTGRCEPLLRQLENFPQLEVKRIRARMVRADSDLVAHKIDYSEKAAVGSLGRKLSYPEIGCASSHNIARSIFAATPKGGVVLEDDARICDLTEFVTLSRNFLHARAQESAILNFSNSSPLNDICCKRTGNDLYYVRRISPTPLAVGYAITVPAAQRLILNNNPIGYVSDWPSWGINFYSPNHEYVHHGDSATISTIDPTNSYARSKSSYIKPILILSGIDFVLRIISGEFHSSYIPRVWWKTFSHKLSFIRGIRHNVKS